MREITANMKLAAPEMAASDLSQRNKALKNIMNSLSEHKQLIFEANQQDVESAKANGLVDSVLKRLKFNEDKLKDVLAGLDQLMGLEDPLGKISLHRSLDEGLELKRITCPIGVIGIIFEARPDALVQIASLCIKSGNAAIIKGGKETAKTNKALFELIHEAAIAAGLPEYGLYQAELHSEIDELLACHESVDLLIPRGSNAFVKYIMEHTQIPVMGHTDGICHTYLDETADLTKAIPIIVDAKTQYSAACNATETLLVHRAMAKEALPAIAKALVEAGVRLRGSEEVSKIIDCEIMTEEEYRTEYLGFTISIKLVEDVKEAVRHINYYGSHHTDCILTEDEANEYYFMRMVDSADVYCNCSTRFADGFRYGFGAEVGISTAKIHARGPVGLEGLVTYKYNLKGNGHIVGDYASGKRSFHFEDLDA